jgi:hypothetical protein
LGKSYQGLFAILASERLNALRISILDKMAKKAGEKIRLWKKSNLTEKPKKRTGMCYTDDDIVAVDGFGNYNRTSSSTAKGIKQLS